MPSIRIASAASNGPIVKKSPIGRIATSGLYSRPIRAMSLNTAGIAGHIHAAAVLQRDM